MEPQVQNTTRKVAFQTDDISLDGDLVIPSNAQAVILFAHGSGSSRFSPRNRFVASRLNSLGLATLLVDLLSAEEEKADAYTAEYRFDIDFLAKRLTAATEMLKSDEEMGSLPIGLFGASTGAAAALVVAAERSKDIFGVVSRGGRPDLAMYVLPDVKAPTLLVVGGYDLDVLELNKKAYNILTCEKELAVVPGATHLFEEPGALEKVADLAGAWFKRHL